MSNKSEEKYFEERFAELRRDKRKALEKAAEETQRRRAMGEELGVDSDALLQRLRGLGYDEDTARVVDLLPLIHVAWADGEIQRAERSRILEVLSGRNISADSNAWLLVEALLETRPADAYMQESLGLLRDILAESKRDARSVVDMCAAIAETAGGILGLGNKVSDEEAEAISNIAKALGVDSDDASSTLFG